MYAIAKKSDMDVSDLIDGFPHRLKRAMETAKIIQADLVRSTGMDPSTITSYTNGRTKPNLEKLVMFSLVLGVRIEWLATGRGPMSDYESTHLENLFALPETSRDNLEIVVSAQPTLRQQLEGHSRTVLEDFAKAYRALFESFQDFPQEERPSNAELIAAAKAIVGLTP